MKPVILTSGAFSSRRGPCTRSSNAPNSHPDNKPPQSTTQAQKDVIHTVTTFELQFSQEIKHKIVDMEKKIN